jgi:hypothetical protein
MNAATRSLRHAGGVAAQAVLIAAIVAALALALSPLYGPARTITGAGGVDAGRGGHGIISVPDGFFGGTVTATANPGGTDAWARAFCYQDGQMVYGQYVVVNADNVATFRLGPTQVWTGGYASCTAGRSS